MSIMSSSTISTIKGVQGPRAISESAPVHGVRASVRIARKNGQAGAGQAFGDQKAELDGLVFRIGRV